MKLNRTPVSFEHYNQTLDMFNSTLKWSTKRREKMYQTYCHNVENGLFSREVFWVQKDTDGNIVERVCVLNRFLQEESAHIELENQLKEAYHEKVSLDEHEEPSDFRDPPLTDIDVCKKMLQISKSASGRNLDFDLTFTSIKNIMRSKRCYFTGKPVYRSIDVNHADKLTIDRLDPNKGYVIGNCVASSYQSNQLKSLFEREIDEGMSKNDRIKMLEKMLIN